MPEDRSELPTVEQCVTFHRTINKGRVAIGLEPLKYLEFDEAMPGYSAYCLSAVNLFWEAGYVVYSRKIKRFLDRTPREQVMIIAPKGSLPSEILDVTDYFDSIGTWDEGRVRLRARMVEAGVVAP